MRDYAKLGPTFWTGETGKALRRRGSEGVIVALYLISSPHSNMLGLYYQPIPYMGYETGLGEEGASKGLQHCIDVGFCSYDEDTEMVFVHEMAQWQIAEGLKPNDKRCKGVQKDYESLPANPFLGAFFDRYSKAFHLPRNRGPSQAPSKPLRSQEQEQEQEQEQDPLTGSAEQGASAAPKASAPAAVAAATTSSARGRRLPADWRLPKDWGEWALAEFPQWTADKVRREGDTFRDHWCSKAGKDAAKLDWLAAWRNWCRSDIAHRDDPKPLNGAHRPLNRQLAIEAENERVRLEWLAQEAAKDAKREAH